MQACFMQERWPEDCNRDKKRGKKMQATAFDLESRADMRKMTDKIEREILKDKREAIKKGAVLIKIY